MLWNPIDCPPAEDGPVLLYYGRWSWRDGDGSVADLGPHRSVCDRVQAGWFEAGRFHVAGTGHEACQSDDETRWPTHWALLTAPAGRP